MIDTAPEGTLVLGLESRIYAARLLAPAEPPKGGTPNGGSVKQRPDRSKRRQFWLLAFPRFQASRPYRAANSSVNSTRVRRSYFMPPHTQPWLAMILRMISRWRAIETLPRRAVRSWRGIE